MSLIIEAGKFYKTRDGRKVGPMVSTRGTGESWGREWDFTVKHAVNSLFGIAWRSDGTFDPYSSEKEDPADIVAEWEEGPVRTVTRREIVPGGYGDVHVAGEVVGHPDGRRVMVSIGTRSDADIVMSARELRSAAMILSQLAEALDESKS